MASEISTSDHSFFRYDPLVDTDSIRLLYISPSPRRGADLQCELITIRLSEICSEFYESLDFIALSYVWGNMTQRKPIFIGSKVIHIGFNLYDALYHIRRREESVLVWADGVCINQEDVSVCQKYLPCYIHTLRLA
jgi:hypothetical protein